MGGSDYTHPILSSTLMNILRNGFQLRFICPSNILLNSLMAISVWVTTLYMEEHRTELRRNLFFIHLKTENVMEQMYSLCILLYYRQRKTVLAVILPTLPWKYMNWFLRLFLHFLFSPNTKLHPCSFLLLHSIRKSGVAIHNFTSGRLLIKLYVHSVRFFLKNLNENIKDAQFSSPTARGDLTYQMADYICSVSETKKNNKKKKQDETLYLDFLKAGRG